MRAEGENNGGSVVWWEEVLGTRRCLNNASVFAVTFDNVGNDTSFVQGYRYAVI